MPKTDRPETQDSSEITVHLKPIGKIRPAVYLTVLYALVLALLVFFFLFYPGIRNRGSYLAIETFPRHATVTVDGVYAGSTPCTIFLKHGPRAVEVSKPFYGPLSLQRNVGGRVFGTLFVPDRARQTAALKLADLDGLLKWALGDFQKNPDIPQIVSDAAWAARDAGPAPEMVDFVRSAMLSVTDESQLRELVTAAARISSRATVLTPGSLVDLVFRLVDVEQDYDNFPSWLLLALTRANGDRLAASPWVAQYRSEYKDSISRYYQPPNLALGSGGGATNIGGMAFRSIPSGVLVMGKDTNLDALGKAGEVLLAHPVLVRSFFLGTAEVTNAQFQAFVAENPDWAPGNRAALAAKGLAAEDYLADWVNGRTPAGREELPVTMVSWHAAAAYCDWLNRRVQSVLPGSTARLPTEAEWEWAARGGLRGMPYPLGVKPGTAVFFTKGATGPSRAGASDPNGYGLRDMIGNVWEWCADPFSVTAELLSSLDPAKSQALELALPDSPDRAVRGGSWASQPGADKVYTRGSQPTQWCTPYLGFRVAIVRK
jgi:gamma-glutamyl hercynylcysteine S-oxide synthase